MSKLYIMVAPPGAGKTTYATELTKQGIVRISQDDLGPEKHLKEFHRAIEDGLDIVVDRMHFDKKQRERYLKPAKEAGYETEIVVFHVPRSVCFERCMARNGHPTINGLKSHKVIAGQEAPHPEVEKARQANSALDTFFTKYERVENTEADKVTRLGWDAKHSAIICDLDGTLCDITHRLHHVKHEVKKHNRWDLFNKEIPNDSINHWCQDLLEVYNRENYHSIVLCSGRVDNSRNDTETWLKKHEVRYDNLLMRHRSDFRQDYIIKEVILDFEILPRYNVLFAIDDRKQVVDMWRRRGIVCLQCAEGDF